LICAKRREIGGFGTLEYLRSSQIAVLTEEGEISQQRLPNDPVRLEKFFAELPPHTPVAIEAYVLRA